MNPDQTVPKEEQSDLGPYCLQYSLPKNISRCEEQMSKVVTGGLRIGGILCCILELIVPACKIKREMFLLLFYFIDITSAFNKT